MADVPVPCNVEAEEAILGAMLSDRSVQARMLAGGLERGDLFRPAHRLVFDAIQRGQAREGYADELVTISVLKSMPKVRSLGEDGGREVSALAVVGGAPAVLTLAQRCPAVANANAYAAEVRRQAQKRRLLEAAQVALEAANDPTLEPEEAIGRAEAALLEAARTSGGDGAGDIRTGTETAEAFADQYVRRFDSEGDDEDTIGWPWEQLDEKIGRMRAGDVIVVSGWSKDGKTWWALDMEEAAHRQGKRVAYFTGEMSDVELLERFVAMGGHPYSAVQDARLPWGVLQDRLADIEGWDRVTVGGRLTIERIRAHVARARLEGTPFQMIVVDHLHLLRPSGRQERREFYEDACAELKAIGQEYGVVVVLLCQLKKAAERNGVMYPPPILPDLKETSGIEQIATTAVFVYRQRDEDGRRLDASNLLIPYHRSRPAPGALSALWTGLHPTDKSKSYRFVEKPSGGEVATVDGTPAGAVQQELEGTFGPVVVTTPDDVPF